MRTTDDLRDLIRFVAVGTIILLDIDDTLFTSASDYMSQEYLNRNTPIKEQVGEEEYQRAFRKIRDFKNTEVEPYLQYRLLQSDLIKILQECKDKGADIMCLTARNPSDARVAVTEKVLRDLGILPYLSNVTIATNDLKSDHPVRVQNGVIYANNFNPKHEVFAKVRPLLPKQYSNVLYGEDAKKVAEDFQNNQPTAKVFHYTRKEFFTSAYNEELVKFQEQELLRTKALGAPKIPTNFESRISLFEGTFQEMIKRRKTQSNALPVRS